MRWLKSSRKDHIPLAIPFISKAWHQAIWWFLLYWPKLQHRYIQDSLAEKLDQPAAPGLLDADSHVDPGWKTTGTWAGHWEVTFPENNWPAFPNRKTLPSPSTAPQKGINCIDLNKIKASLGVLEKEYNNPKKRIYKAVRDRWENGKKWKDNTLLVGNLQKSEELD